MGQLSMSNWVAWSTLAGKNNMEKEGGVGGRGEERHNQVKCECGCGLVWLGLVWFGLVLALALVLVVAGPGSGKVQSGAVRCGAGCGCMRRREMRQVGVLFQVESPRYPSRNPP